MIVLYTLGIRFYILLLHLISPFHAKAKLMVSGRKGWYEDLKKKVDPKGSYIWFHCSSLGEFEQGRPLIEAARKKFPEHKIVLSFFSPSGYEIRKNYDGADIVCYMPFDTRKSASRFLELIKPSAVFFVKYEYWYFFLRLIKRKGIQAFLVSAIFRNNQIFFKPYGAWFRKILSCFTTMFVQDATSQKLLESVGFVNVVIAGDTRFDRVADVVKHKKEVSEVNVFKGDSPVVVAGSTWPQDEALLCNYINNCKAKTKYIIAPHEIHKEHIASIVSLLKVPTVVYSSLPEQEEDLRHAKVLIIDTIGILSSLYQYGELSYIGGGFGVGIHNTLEAATYGIPVIFGPNYFKFREAVELIDEGGAFTISDQNALSERLDLLLGKPALCADAGAKAGLYVQRNVGATQKILRLVRIA